MIAAVRAAARDALTLLAVRWLRSNWKPHQQIPQIHEVPWIDARSTPTLVLGPGVVEPPGLVIDFTGQLNALSDYPSNLTTTGRSQGVWWLLDNERPKELRRG